MPNTLIVNFGPLWKYFPTKSKAFMAAGPNFVVDFLFVAEERSEQVGREHKQLLVRKKFHSNNAFLLLNAKTSNNNKVVIFS